MKRDRLAELDPERTLLSSALMHAALSPRRLAILHARPSTRCAIAAAAVHGCGASLFYAPLSIPAHLVLMDEAHGAPHVALIDRAEDVPIWLNVPHVIVLDAAQAPALGWEEAMRLGRERLSHYDKDIAERSALISSDDLDQIALLWGQS